MNERVKYPIVITLICLVAAAALAVTFAMTQDRIAASKKSELVKGLGRRRSSRKYRSPAARSCMSPGPSPTRAAMHSAMRPLVRRRATPARSR